LSWFNNWPLFPLLFRWVAFQRLINIRIYPGFGKVFLKDFFEFPESPVFKPFKRSPPHPRIRS
jgi:hypothetical protein